MAAMFADFALNPTPSSSGQAQGMRFRIENVFIQTNEVGRGEDEIEILEGFGSPEALERIHCQQGGAMHGTVGVGVCFRLNVNIPPWN